MKTKSKSIEQRDAFFMKQFNEFFEEWKKKDKKKNTQGEFARQICEIRNKKTGEQCPVTNSYVSEWKRGVWFPEQYLPEIAEVLGVEPTDFIATTHDDLYKFSSDFMNKIGDEKIKPYCDEIGYHVQFQFMLRTLFGSEFESVFPFWTPIDRSQTIQINRDILQNMYSHRDLSSLAASAPMENSYSIFQANITVDDDGKSEDRTITLSQPDLLFLRDVQEEVKNYIEYLFWRRKEELKREGEEASMRSWKPIKGQKNSKGFVPLKAKELNEVDKYFDGYADPEEK